MYSLSGGRKPAVAPRRNTAPQHGGLTPAAQRDQLVPSYQLCKRLLCARLQPRAPPALELLPLQRQPPLVKLKQRLNTIIAKHTGKSIDQVEKDCDRDNFMSSEEAKAYGLVDHVVQSRKEIPGGEKVTAPIA